MSGWVTVEGIPLWESRTAEADADSVQIAGRAHFPTSPVEFVNATHHSVLGLRDRVVPAVFTDKSELTGFYRVSSASSSLTQFAAGAVVQADWSLTLERLGSSRDVEIESRVPTIARLDELTGTQTPSYWHAPAVGFTSYWTGSTVPNATVPRVSADGTVTTFTGIPTSVAPRWTIPAESYLLGSSRILLDDIRRAGTFTPPHTTWEINNGLVRVAGAANGAFSVSCWDSGVWASSKDFQLTLAATAVTTTPELTILRNDPEEVTVRLSYPTSPGRLTVDLSIRRGSRFMTGVIKRHSVSDIGVRPVISTTATSVTGGLRYPSDADGNRSVVGSSRTLGVDTGGGRVEKAGVLSLDFFLGHEFGSSPATGDAFADLLLQYLGSAGERTRVVRR